MYNSDRVSISGQDKVIDSYGTFINYLKVRKIKNFVLLLFFILVICFYWSGDATETYENPMLDMSFCVSQEKGQHSDNYPMRVDNIFRRIQLKVGCQSLSCS